MTQPVSEPTNQRYFSSLAYQNSQLRRRPAATVPFEWGWAYFTTDQTVSTGIGSFLVAQWDDIYVPDGQTTLVVNPNGTTDNTEPFQINAPCMISQSVRMQFTDIDWSDIRNVSVNHGASCFGPETHNGYKGAGSGQGSSLFYSATMWMAMGGSAVDSPKVAIYQTSGSSKTLTGGNFLVVVLGLTPNIGDMTPFAP